MILKISTMLALFLAIATITSGCARQDRHQTWAKSNARITAIKELKKENSADTTSPKYIVEFTFKLGDTNYSAEQIITQAQANLITEGQTLKVHINPEKKKNSELELPVPYPDKSGMNWRRMPKSLTTPGTTSNPTNY